jgi:hypothetical protein
VKNSNSCDRSLKINKENVVRIREKLYNNNKYMSAKWEKQLLLSLEGLCSQGEEVISERLTLNR